MNIERIAAALGLTKEKKIRADLIIKQINAKGFLTMEDFKYQLGDMLPGVFNVLLLVTNLSAKEADIALMVGELKSDLLEKVIIEYQKLCGI
jgi:tape measure domain-containing protein